MNREEFGNKLKLRKLVRDRVAGLHKTRSSELYKEFKLRSYVRRILKEVEISDSVPHRSTGINVLEDLLKKIIPVVEQDFKSLTSNNEQRNSYKTHILQGIKNILAPSRATKALDRQLSEDLDLSIGDGEDKFIDVDRPGKKDKKQSPEDKKKEFSIPGEDETGRNVALTTFEKIEKNIIDAYDVLSDEEDQHLFYDYLLTNLKLYFEKFEDEIVADPSVAEM